MSVPKTAACKFIESKTITIPGPDKFPEVNPTNVKPVKSNDEGFGNLEDQRYTEDEDKEASARELMRKAASMDDKHDCSKVHPDMTHEKWEALQEKQAQGLNERVGKQWKQKMQLLREQGADMSRPSGRPGSAGGAAVGRLNQLPIELSRDDAISAGIIQGRSWNPATWFSSPAKNTPAKLTIPPGSADYSKALPYRKKSSAADIGANLAKQAFNPQAMGKWLDEPRPLNPDEEEQIRRGKKQWRGTKSHNPEISELMRSPWAAATEGALGSGLMMGGAGALYGGLRGSRSGNAGPGALIAGGALGALGAGIGGFSEYHDQKELNKSLEALMRQQSEERATISDLERNLMEEEERYRQEVIRGDKQANADRVQEFVSQGLPLADAVRAAYPSWSDEQVAEYVGQQKQAGFDHGSAFGNDAVGGAVSELERAGFTGITPADGDNMVGGTVAGAGLGAAAVPGAIGALGGGVYGLLAPGRNRKGEQRNRLVEAIKRSLIYGTLGAGAGVAGLGGGLVGGVAGLGNELQTISDREGWDLGGDNTPPDKVVEGSAMTRAQRAYRDAEERLRSFEQ